MIDNFVNHHDETQAIIVTGDLVLDVPDAAYWLSGIAPVLKGADLAIGHLEVPHTLRGFEIAGDVPAPGAPPENLDAMAAAGIGVVTMAGNHMNDCGPEGIRDTITRLEALGVAHCGAGETLADARRPSVIGLGSRSIAILSYNCVGPELSWASENTAGTAYLRIEADDGGAISPKKNLVQPGEGVAEILANDIKAARETAITQNTLVIVALHKGIVHTPAKLAPYERPLARMAIEAGADVVISHHAHIVRGMEFYQGKPIFHGLGNGCVVTEALSPDQDHPARAEWAQKRKVMFGFEPDPAYRLAPFHPEAVNAFLGRLLWHPDGRIEAGFIPVHIDPPGRPRLADLDQSARITDYVRQITMAADLPPLTFTPRSDMVVLS